LAFPTRLNPYDNAFRRQQAEQTQRRILEALIGQLGRSLEDFSIAEVAEAAGVSVRTVYQHFPNREAQIEAVTAVLDERLTRSEPGAKSISDIPAIAERIFRQAAGHVAEMRAQTASGLGARSPRPAPSATRPRDRKGHR
jgi:AcrR family transcriptional regulator